MVKKHNNLLKNPYFIIALIYLAAHFFLLILTGCWWDDWTFMSHDMEYINLVASQSGRPEWNILMPLCWSLPNNGRILIFFLFLFDSFLVYQILKESSLFNEKESLYITLLFTVIPVNESRLLISNFPYSVGLLFFYLGFLLFIKWNKSNKKTIYRILLLLLFYISFILNSLLAYYYIIFIYLFILEFIRNDGITLIKRIFISIKNILVKYFDFFILPFVSLLLNKILFPVTSETFEARSSISISGLLKCIKYLPLSMINIVKDIVKKYYECLSYWPVIIICLLIIIYVYLKNKDNEEKDNKQLSLVLLFFGLIIFALGIFPYVEVRGNVLTAIGVKGRDAILAPLGIAMFIYGITSLLNNKYKAIVCSLIVFVGILSCNLLYIEWQKDYYYQLSIENQMNNKIIEENDTFFLADLNETEVEGQRYYTLNANAYNVFGDETRFFIPKVSNLYILKSNDAIKVTKEELASSHIMRDYNPSDNNIDAVLIFDCNFDWKQVLELKYLELFDNNNFNRIIKASGDMKVIEVDDGFTPLLIDEVDNNNINDDYGVVELLEVYYNVN